MVNPGNGFPSTRVIDRITSVTSFRFILCTLLFCQLHIAASSGTQTRSKTSNRVVYRLIDRWEFKDFKVDGLTLDKAVEKFRKNSGPKDHPDLRINVVVKWSQLNDVQKTAKIFMDGTGHRAKDIIHVLAVTLGLGYKIEDHAVVIGSREHYPLPETESTTLGPMLESIRTEPKIIIRYEDE